MTYIKVIRSYAFIFVLSMFPCAVKANSSFASSTISGLIVHDFGTAILINLAANAQNSEGCIYNNQLVLKKDHPFFKEAYSALLATFHSSGKIQGWVNGCDSTFKAPILTRLDLIK